MEQTAISGVSQLQLSLVRQHLEALHEEITEESPVEVIERQSRLLILMIFGGIQNSFPEHFGKPC